MYWSYFNKKKLISILTIQVRTFLFPKIPLLILIINLNENLLFSSLIYIPSTISLGF